MFEQVEQFRGITKMILAEPLAMPILQFLPMANSDENDSGGALAMPILRFLPMANSAGGAGVIEQY